MSEVERREPIGPEAPVEPDAFLSGVGSSVILVHLQSEAARQWADEYIGSDNGFQPYWPEKIVVEPRYIWPIVDGMQQSGLRVN